jgi:hypothetical protein
MLLVTPMFKMIDTLDRMDMGLESGEKGIRVAISGTPMKVSTAAAGANLPGMPADVFARLDTNFAASESGANIRKQIQGAFNRGLTSDPTLTADQKKQLTDIGDQVGALLFDASSTSLGVGLDGTDPVTYVVQHWANPTDVQGKLKALIKRMDNLLGKNDDEVVAETYADKGITVLRISHKSAAPSEFEFDVAQHQNDVYMTISPSDKHLVLALMSVRPQGLAGGALSGSIDLGKSLEAAEKIPTSPLAGLSADTQKQLAGLLSGQKIRISTSSDGETGSLELTATKGLLENVPKLIAAFTGGAPKADKDAQ